MMKLMKPSDEMKLLSKLFATILHCILLGPEAAVAGEQVSSTLEHMDDNSYVIETHKLQAGTGSTGSNL